MAGKMASDQGYLVLTGKKAGVHVGRVAIRKSGSFNIQMPNQVVQGIRWKHCRII